MQNQASNLRKVSGIAVASGKGGVGKTLVATNLAYYLKELGRKVLIFDLDVGFTNVDILLGVTPKFTIKNYVTGNCGIEDLVTPSAYGIDLVSLGSDVSDLLSTNEITLKEFFINFLKLIDRYDYVIFDMPPGFSEMYLPFFTIVDDFVVLTTTEPTAIVNTYTIIKILVLKGVSGENIHLVANMVTDVKEATKLMERFSSVVEKFSGTKIKSVTIIRAHNVVSKSIANRELFIAKYKNTQPSFSVMRLASIITSEKIEKSENILEKIWSVLFRKESKV